VTPLQIVILLLQTVAAGVR